MTHTIRFITPPILLGLIGGLLVLTLQPIKSKEPIVQAVTQKPEPQSYIKITKQDLEADIMANYPSTTNKAKRDIVDAIIEVEQTYNINPIITYSFGRVESSWKSYAVHKETVINTGKKKLSVRAIGSMGIIFEWWGEKLIKAGIITNRADLLDPVLSIRAFGFIYNELRSMPMHPSARNKDESAMLRYFGGDHKSYIDKIEGKIGSLIAAKLYRSK